MKKFYKKLIIFDLDGVLIDSKKNMEISWQEVQKNHNIKKIKFEDYFKQIGKPFKEILKSIGIKKNYNKIEKTYKIASIKNIDKIKYYKGALKTLKKLRSNNIDLCIVTSKDQHRTKKILKKNIKLFKYIECDDGKLKGKPNPDKIYNIINKTNYNKRDILFVGDTYIDYITAKNSNIDFMYIKDGYGKNFNYKNKSKNISDLQKKLLN